MSCVSGQVVTKIFTVRGSSGAVNADSLPTGTLYVNGTANAAAVTVTNLATGIYKASVTLPTLAITNLCDLVIQATVSGVTDNMPIWTDVHDVALDASGYVALQPAGLDAVLVESGITASAALTNDAGTQLTAINFRQAVALCVAALAGQLSGASGTTIDILPGGNPGGNNRVQATVDSNGDRSALTLKVPT